jgi:signal transduction histidine kinase
MFVFGEHDLARRSPFPRIDLVMSKNVLIYFAPELQRRALQLFAYSLRDESDLPPYMRSQIFSILREGLRNAVRHSGSDHLLVELSLTAEAATGSVEDDGRGLTESTESGTDGGNGAAGGGLRSMKERAALLGGHLRLLSPPGGGTRVEVTVPLDRIGN